MEQEQKFNDNKTTFTMCKQGLNRIDAADSQQTKQSSIWNKQKRINFKNRLKMKIQNLPFWNLVDFKAKIFFWLILVLKMKLIYKCSWRNVRKCAIKKYHHLIIQIELRRFKIKNLFSIVNVFFAKKALFDPRRTLMTNRDVPTRQE